MERKLQFKPPRITRTPHTVVHSAGVEFYSILVEQHAQMRLKERQFEAELQDRRSRQLSMLQVRNEKQQLAVKEFEQEAIRDQLWERFNTNIQKLNIGNASEGLKKYITAHVTPSLEHKYRKRVCDKLVEDLVHHRIVATLQEMKDLAGLFDLSQNVTTDPRQLVQYTASLTHLHSIIVTATHKGRAASTLDSLHACRRELNEHLNSVTLPPIEADPSLSGDVVAARLALADINKQIAAFEKRAHDHQIAQEKEKTAAVTANAAIAVPAVNSMTTTSQSTTSSCLDAHFPYISANRATLQWLEEIKTPALQSVLPPEYEEELRRAVESLQYDNLLSGKIFGSNNTPTEDSMMGNPDSGDVAGIAGAGSVGVPLKNVDQLLSLLETLLHSVVKGGAQPFLRVLITLSEAVLAQVQSVSAENDIQMYAVVVCGMFRALSSKMYQQSARIFHALLCAAGGRCVPDLLSGGNGGGSSKVVLLFASLVGQYVETEVTANRKSSTSSSAVVQAEVKVTSPLTAAQGWTWLHRAVTQLQVATSLCTQTSAAATEAKKQLKITDTTVSDICKIVRTFIRLAGSSVALKYQDKFVELLRALQTTLAAYVKSSASKSTGSNVDVQKLVQLVEASIRSRYVTPCYYKNQAPFMLDGAALTRYCDRERAAMLQAESDKKGPFMVRVKELQIDRLRVIFNKLSVTAESQQAAVSSLLEKIIISNKESPDFLKYTLFKIATNIASDCQEEFFNEMDEGHPLKLARVSVGLCGSIAELGDLIKAQFYKQCPLCVPKAAEVGLSGEDFLRDMGFRAKNTTSGAVQWEGKSQWLARMSKMLCTFCVIMTQPEQYPLGLSDAWAWLASLVNLSTPNSTNTSSTNSTGGTAAAATAVGPKPPFFTATALEVMLRVTASHLLAAYGEAFMSVLIVVNTTIMPHLGADMPRKEELGKFLKSFINSKGADFMSLFNKPVNG